ncbi:alanine racemase family protein, putative [Talaromyces stipitatus ATCC 10500]|uniref:Pyridoxal phosphate homeostasis protein n=1 Tax=Talaromyces stipitatus (strain ATCC 10500 / CBS 375.48 / QM 6759 / NRRL 1006) TaxID=441959 RepID=B8MDU2_TALSN|nr:alanine racemase family protein, putative [Talaromyces stipitatus ATCC 10500]EED18321.1 alanine racemase family protein, putative [Talaromyces stipitatus ATCC 10500]
MPLEIPTNDPRRGKKFPSAIYTTFLLLSLLAKIEMTSTLDTVTMSTPARTATLLTNLNNVLARISAASSIFQTTSTSTTRRHRPADKPVRLVAVSKLKPASDILALYSPSSFPSDETPTATTTTPSATQQLHFGENYFQELLEKSRILPRGIRWHFIGGLQSNKCTSLARDVRGLWAVESVDTEKKAKLLDKGWGERDFTSLSTEEQQQKLRVFVQVNTSGEENKSGVEPALTPALCRYIRDNCPGLKLQGLMTIGAIARSKETTADKENEDFVTLIETREVVVRELGLTEQEADDFELSMGMSSDFEGAIALGSDQVRVGTTIFGERPVKAGANAGAAS